MSREEVRVQAAAVLTFNCRSGHQVQQPPHRLAVTEPSTQPNLPSERPASRVVSAQGQAAGEWLSPTIDLFGSWVPRVEVGHVSVMGIDWDLLTTPLEH